MASTKRKLEDLSVEDFMAGSFDSEDSTSSDPTPQKVKKKKNKKKKKKPNAPQTEGKEKSETVLKPEKKPKQKATKTEKTPSSGKKKQSLAEKLKNQDPEFFEFLKSEDKELLNFDEDIDDVDDSDVSNDEDDEEKREADVAKKLEKELLEQSSDDSSDEDDDESGGKYHRPPAKLEVASDDSDYEEEEEDDEEKTSPKKKAGGLTEVTIKMVKQWTETFQKNPTIAVVREAISAFKAAVKKADDKEGGTIKYKVAGGTVFNAVVRLCLTEMVPALQKILNVPDLTQQQTPFSGKNAKWKKIQVDVKSYLTDLLTLLTALSDPAMLEVLLRHVHKLVSMFASFPKVARLFMKKTILFWSSGEETTRVLAFLCINKLVRMLREVMLETCMKQMYLAYVKNVKFTSPTTLPLINFMQRSLVEVFLLDPALAYQYAFVYIRQLAIHLRNAITVKKKETCQAVYNWQFLHCLDLWSTLLGTSYPDRTLEPLIYPLTQTIIGTIKLLPAPRYFPLRFHCVRSLNKLSKSTGTFIPVLPFLLEVFEQTDFNKKHKSVSAKPFNFACIFKLSRKQQEEKVFKDGLIDQLYELFLEHFNVHASSIGFPELVLPALLQLKDFLKKCKVANYCKQIRQIVDRVEENVKFINQRRKSVTFAISDLKAVDAWERDCRTAGTPLGKFYNNWRTLRDRELQHEIADKERISFRDDIPKIERPKGPLKPTKEERKEFTSLFESDSDESGDDESRFLPSKQKKRKKDSEDSDEYSDFDSDELEQLAKSASEDEDDDDDDEEDDDDDDDDLDEEDDDLDDDESSDEETTAVKSPRTSQQPKAKSRLKQKQTLKSQNDEDSDLDLEDVVEDFEMSDSD